MTYKSSFRINLRETDAAGIMFFPNIFAMAHGCYEEFMDRRGAGLADILKDGKFLLPVVHAEADYRAPISLSRKVLVQMDVVRIGKSSFTLSFSFRGKAGAVLAEVKTVHVTVDSGTGKSIPLPRKIRNALGKAASRG